MAKKKLPKPEKLGNGRIRVGRYIFSAHFFRRWRDRHYERSSDEKIALEAYEMLLKSHLVHLDQHGGETRLFNGTLFIVRGNTVITTMNSWQYHRLHETDYYLENKEKIDAATIIQ